MFFRSMKAFPSGMSGSIQNLAVRISSLSPVRKALSRICAGCVNPVWKRLSGNAYREEFRYLASAEGIKCLANRFPTPTAPKTAERFLSGAEFSGYEIHLGRTGQPENALTTCGGAYSGTVAGCYVHGIFDSAEVSGRIIRELYTRKGVVYHGQAIDRRTYKEQQFDLLADTVRRSLDMNRIYQILQEGL